MQNFSFLSNLPQFWSEQSPYFLLIRLIILTLTILICGLLPFAFGSLKSKSQQLFYLGTGAMFGICAFDLIPELIETSGTSGLLKTAGVWIVYSIAHLFHVGHHHHPAHSEDDPLCATHLHVQECRTHIHDAEHDHPKNEDKSDLEQTYPHRPSSYLFFLASMFFHTFSTGLLLTAANHTSVEHSESTHLLVNTLFWALFVHKAVESFIVSAVLQHAGKTTNQRDGFSNSKLFSLTALYWIAFPIGAGLSLLLEASISAQVAEWATSIAAGSLLGCLIFDFLIPSIKEIKKEKRHLRWLVAGLAMVQVLVWFHH